MLRLLPLVALLTMVIPQSARADSSDPRAQREKVRAQRTEAARKLNALTAWDGLDVDYQRLLWVKSGHAIDALLPGEIVTGLEAFGHARGERLLLTFHGVGPPGGNQTRRSARGAAS